MDWAWNNLQRLICHKTKQTNKLNHPPPTFPPFLLFFIFLLLFFIFPVLLLFLFSLSLLIFSTSSSSSLSSSSSFPSSSSSSSSSWWCADSKKSFDSRFSFLSTVALVWSSRQYLVSIQSWWMEVFVNQQTLVCPWVGVHWRMPLMSSCLLIQQCQICCVCISCVVCEMWDKSMYIYCFFNDAASRICSEQHVASFCSSHRGLCPRVSLKYK